MVEIVDYLLTDLGLYGSVPATFPELIVWETKFVVAAALVAGIIKTCFIVCREIGERLDRK